MVAILQTMFSEAFSWMESLVKFGGGGGGGGVVGWWGGGWGVGVNSTRNYVVIKSSGLSQSHTVGVCLGMCINHNLHSRSNKG